MATSMSGIWKKFIKDNLTSAKTLKQFLMQLFEHNPDLLDISSAIYRMGLRGNSSIPLKKNGERDWLDDVQEWLEGETLNGTIIPVVRSSKGTYFLYALFASFLDQGIVTRTGDGNGDGCMTISANAYDILVTSVNTVTYKKKRVSLDGSDSYLFEPV